MPGHIRPIGNAVRAPCDDVEIDVGNSNTKQGILLGLAGFALLAATDAVVKSMVGEWPGTAVSALRFALGAVGLGTIVTLREGARGFAPPDWGIQVKRGLALGLASLCFFLALFAMPQAEATAIQFANPMLTALVSAWLLHERPTRATLLATVVAFAGVLIVLRPNVQVLGLAALLPLGAAVGMAFLLTFNRMSAGDTSALAAQFFAALFATPLLLVATAIGHASGQPALHVDWPSASVILRCAVAATAASLAHGLIYVATVRASSATIAPTVYVQIIVAIITGYLVFGDVPDGWSLFGTAIIIGAGLWLWARPRGATPVEERRA